MKITLSVFAVILLSASTFADISSRNSLLDETDSKPTDVPEYTSASSTGVPPTITTTLLSSSSSSEPTTTPSTSSQPTTVSSSSEPTTTPTSSQPTTMSSTSSVPTTTLSTTSTTSTPKTTTSYSTTSVKPITSTEGPVTTTSPPIPVPEPGYWNVTEGNTTCIRANMALRFKIKINDVIEYVSLSPTATIDNTSSCNTSDHTERLVLKDKEYIAIFVFEKNADNVYVKNISFTYFWPMLAETFTNDSHLFNVKAGSSYLCKTVSDVILGNATMEIISIHIQAFGAEHNKDFAGAEECVADSPINDIVPIAVGVALLSLCVVVLVAYLLGRRRSRQKGYQSV